MRILLLFLRFGTINYADSLPRVHAYYASCLPGVQYETIIVDNELGLGYQGYENDYLVLGGSNQDWEFSAIDEALSYIGNSVYDYDFVHVATSACWQLYNDYIYRVNVSSLRALSCKDAMLGHIDAYNEQVNIFAYSAQYWIRTSFFFLSPLSIARVGSFVSIKYASLPQIFSGDPSSPFLANAPLSKSFQSNIISWLTGGGTGQGTEWHSRFLLSIESLPYFERKAMAIINENLLTQRFVKLGTAIVDATYLSRPRFFNRLAYIHDVPGQLSIRQRFL